MIDYINGQLTELNPTYAVVEAAGVGYEINIALPTFSAFAGNWLFIDPRRLMKRGLLNANEVVEQEHNVNKWRIDYDFLRVAREKMLRLAFTRADDNLKNEINKFLEENKWAQDVAAYQTAKDKYYQRAWWQWDDEDLRAYKKSAVDKLKEEENYMFHAFVQYIFTSEWQDIKSQINELGIKIIGDMPIYVSCDSADVWAARDLFKMAKPGKKIEKQDEDDEIPETAYIFDKVAGVPPDYFSATGQRWGNPIYNWKKMEKEDFSFLIERLERNGELYDVIRLDHFRAFDTYWKIPASCPTAIDGEWVLAPGYRFFEIFQSKCPNIEIIAEDLGELRPHVDILRYHFDFPGMDVIQFTFEESNITKKKKHESVDSVVYVGTHDNDTAIGFFDGLKKEDQVLWTKALDEAKTPKGKINERLIHFAMNKNAAYVILTAQDILGLGNEGRINLPGVINGINWTWRMKDLKALESKVEELHKLNEEYNRL